MARCDRTIRNSLLAGSMLAAGPVLAADVTPERLLNKMVPVASEQY
jgi:hypothetical protein